MLMSDYVDDSLIVRLPTDLVLQVRQELPILFKVVDFGKKKVCLGLNIARDRKN